MFHFPRQLPKMAEGQVLVLDSSGHHLGHLETHHCQAGTAGPRDGDRALWGHQHFWQFVQKQVKARDLPLQVDVHQGSPLLRPQPHLLDGAQLGYPPDQVRPRCSEGIWWDLAALWQEKAEMFPAALQLCFWSLCESLSTQGPGI